MLKSICNETKSSEIITYENEKFSSEDKAIKTSIDSEIINNRSPKLESNVATTKKIEYEGVVKCPIPEKQPKMESIKKELIEEVKPSNEKNCHKEEKCSDEKEKISDEKEKFCDEKETNSNQLLPKVTEKYMKFIKIEVDPNGLGEFVRTDWMTVKKHLTIKEQKEFVDEFIRLAYWEVDEIAIFACAIIDNGAKDIEDMFEWLIKDYSNLPVKYGSLTSKQAVHVTKYKDYYQKVIDNYCNGTFRYGGLEALSIVGKKKEECGDIFEEYLENLNTNIITGPIMPWGKFTIGTNMRPIDSNDGPIFWVRPGEQCFTTDDIDGNIKEKSRPKYCGLRRHAKREIHYEDRTPSHADFTRCGLIQDCTGAVGILKAIRSPSDPYNGINRILKDVVCFPAKYIEEIVQLLDINLSHPPLNQCNIWVDEAKLNQIRRNDIKYVHVSLKEDCVYFLPRKVVHQFRTISACSSIAWHARLKHYYENGKCKIILDHEYKQTKE
ncbi:Hypothetical protein SRAE_X000026200 [Strongyloides ratti]|uniref:JmjC domain-containing protein n=1 Tax=Strongyloides ratti TaxID=34506 RepID=A0A090LRV1_STRRB|nr:Hypothetical protein SRAE_X000026200 [Strongyloides ratti]CEF70932.1 Hypothetical protein SRAE_X000026200 [Strongyloides ratti]